MRSHFVWIVLGSALTVLAMVIVGPMLRRHAEEHPDRTWPEESIDKRMTDFGYKRVDRSEKDVRDFEDSISTIAAGAVNICRGGGRGASLRLLSRRENATYR